MDYGFGRSTISGCGIRCVEERVQCYPSVRFKLHSDFFADLKSETCGVGKIKVMDEDCSELVRGDERLMKVPKESVLQPKGKRRFRLIVRW